MFLATRQLACTYKTIGVERESFFMFKLSLWPLQGDRFLNRRDNASMSTWSNMDPGKILSQLKIQPNGLRRVF